MKSVTKITRMIFTIFGFSLLLSMTLPVDANMSDTPPSLGVIAVGVPKFWGETRNYDDWFGKLEVAGVTAFLPFSEYQEVPEALSLGYEGDFFPPCSYDDAPFQALRKHHIQLVVAGQLLYANGFPPLQDDPLRTLINCTGENMIAAVLSIDEPGITKASDATQNVQALYERVKAVDPSLPVMMVHAPIPSEITEPDGTTSPITQSAVDSYLKNVKNFSTYADIIGFDLYPIPTEVARLIAPDIGLDPVGYRDAFPAYLKWLQENTAGKSYFLVLQAFSFERQLSAQVAQEARDGGYNLRFPTETELQDMACIAAEGSVSGIAWWGQSLLIRDDEPFWNSILAVTKAITTNPTGYCDHRSPP